MRWSAAVLLAPALAGCITTSAPPEGLQPGLLDEPFPGLTSHAQLLERLAALEPLGVLVEPIGRSVEGREMHLVRVGHGPFELWLAARHHGNEPTSTEAVLNTLDYLLGRREPGPGATLLAHELYEHRALLLERLTFVIVPMVNPDGAEKYQRRNADGQDLNRDYLLFKEPESRHVRDAFWRVWPDAGLDLHNEGLGEGYDYDAYYPEVPRAESDTQELSLANQWAVVHDLESVGSYAGGPNENYVTSEVNDPCEYVPLSVPIPPPTGDTNPTAYCEGTHDAFLTLRGAPGWTPEAGIEGGQDSPTLAWAVKQHEATIASAAFFYAGFHHGCAPRLQKFSGALVAQTTIPVVTQGEARFQLVWREDLTGSDQHLEELDLLLRTPSGQMLGPEHHPLGYTETLRSSEAGSHLATIAGRTGFATPYELRVHECRPQATVLDVERAPGGLVATNTGGLPLEVWLHDSLLGAHDVEAGGAEAWVVQGNLAPKTLLRWHFTLAPGGSMNLQAAYPEGAQAGPARWHAHGPEGQVLDGHTGERGSPAPGGL